MTYNFCTIFNRNYLYKGLTLYYSIIKHCSNFKLWILCLDDTTFTTLRKMNLTNIELVTLNKIEDEQFELKINMVVINNLGRININGIENFISNSKKVEFNVIQFPDDLDNYFVSNGHLNEKGNRVLAELLKLLFYK